MPALGELESRVMDALWASRRPRSVRDVHAELVAERDLAYTTVLTVLDRLAKKGHVTRQRDGRAWLYLPVRSRGELVAAAIVDYLDGTDQQRREILGALFDLLPEGDLNFVANALTQRLSAAKPASVAD